MKMLKELHFQIEVYKNYPGFIISSSLFPMVRAVEIIDSKK